MVLASQLILIIGMIVAVWGIALFYIKERIQIQLAGILGLLVQRAEYIKIAASGCVSLAIIVFFSLVPYRSANLLLLIAFLFTFPGDVILSRDLTKLFIAIPLFGVAYLLMSISALIEIFRMPVNITYLVVCVVISVGIILIVVLRTLPKLPSPIMKYAVVGYSFIVATFLFTGLFCIVQAGEILLGISLILLVFNDVLAISFNDKPLKHKALYDLIGGVLYFVPLFVIAVHFTNI